MTEATGIVGEFLALKEGTDADVLAMQCGDFYEFFADDAELVADELDLTVSQKSSHGSSYPMAGVPLSELTPYVSALVERGYRVAVADQHETADGHAREITRLVTPGTFLETMNDAAQYLAAVVRVDDDDSEGTRTYGLAFADVTTGQFHVTQLDGVDSASMAHTELYKFDPAEVLPGPELRGDDDFLTRMQERTGAQLTLHQVESFAPARARHRVRDHFGRETLESVGVDGKDAAIRAAGAVLSYVEETGVGTLASVTRLQAYAATDHVDLDATTQRNLELTETMHGDGTGSLFETLDHSVTSAGARLLRQWIQRPRRDRAELTRRQACIGAFAEAALAREELRETLSPTYDLERLVSRAVSGSADARDLRAVGETISVLESVASLVDRTDRLTESPLTDVLARLDRQTVATLETGLDDALVDDPPGTVTQGGLFARGYDDDLDALIEAHDESLAWIDDLPAREKARTGITHLSVDRNTTDGYYIQVGNSETDQVPDEYDPIKTLKNSERYTIPELTEREREVMRVEERRSEMEYDLFGDLRARVADHAELLQGVGRALAEFDALASLATHAVRNDWTRPALSDGRELSIEGGRHPVVEGTTEFVPNGLSLDDERQFLVVTGPNMSGKSTYMRQAALITLLAQVGSFVPARSARVGLVDGIYTRVGALDELAQGRSTFMVEMQELSNILHSATEESLVILDEVGRGTATYDGISIAWAATEYLHNEIRSKTLFATHYHELTTLADHLDRVENVHIAADESGNTVTFLRTVRDGPTDRSYGVHVAGLAGVPDPVVERSRDVLDNLREEKAIEARGGSGGEPIQAVFDVGSGGFRGQASADGGDSAAGDSVTDQFGDAGADVLDALSAVNVDETSPLDLMATVQAWQDELRER